MVRVTNQDALENLKVPDDDIIGGLFPGIDIVNLNDISMHMEWDDLTYEDSITFAYLAIIDTFILERE